MLWTNKRPAYCDRDQKTHLTMLSRYFKCTKKELLLFERLCSSWEEEIYYRIFLRKIETLAYGIEKTLLIFLKKLENAGFAAIRTIHDERGKFTPEKIILSDRHSLYITQSSIEEHYSRMNYEPAKPYITMETKKIPDHIKKQHIHPLSLTDLHSIYEGRSSTKKNMHYITINNVSVILCMGAFHDFYSATEKKVRNYLKSTHLIADLQRTNPHLFDAQNIHTAIESWQYEKLSGLLTYMRQNYGRITAAYIPAEEHLSQALTIMQYTSAIKTERSAQLKTKQHRTIADYKKIYEKVRNAPQIAISKEEYQEIIFTYKDTWGEIFEKNILALYEQSPQNPLLITEHAVIHTECIAEYFEQKHSEIQEKIYSLLTDDMYKHIKVGDLSINVNYANISKIETHILHILRTKDGILHDLLDYLRQQTSTTVHGRYQIITIFDINLGQIFSSACGKISFFRRWLYRLSSEYNDLHAHFHFLASIIANNRQQDNDTMPHSTQAEGEIDADGSDEHIPDTPDTPDISNISDTPAPPSDTDSQRPVANQERTAE